MKDQFDLRVGVQWSKPDKKISSVYGFDVFAGQRKEVLENHYVPYALDTALCANCYVPSPLVSDRLYRSTTTWLVAGVDFSLGCLFRPSEKVNLSLQWTPEFVFINPLSEEYNVPEARTKAPENEFSFHFRGIEFFLGYLF